MAHNSIASDGRWRRRRAVAFGLLLVACGSRSSVLGLVGSTGGTAISSAGASTGGAAASDLDASGAARGTPSDATVLDAPATFDATDEPDVSSDAGSSDASDAQPAGDAADAEQDSAWDGGPRWRMSEAPLCNGGSFPMTAALWSEPSGVYVRTDQAMFVNQGSGWSTITAAGDTGDGLTGFVGGPLVGYGGNPCGIQFSDGQGAWTCSGAARDVTAVYTVRPDLAYALASDRVLRFDGRLWTQPGSPLPGETFVHALWADQSIVVVGGSGGRAYLFFDSGLTSAPTIWEGIGIVNFTAAWGFGTDDLLLGNQNGELFHYDGLTWSPAWASTGDCRAIGGMWGADGIVYFRTQNSIRRWVNGKVDTIQSFPCDGSVSVNAIWGNSANEMFAVLGYQACAGSRCGAAAVEWFDGSKFREF